MTTTSDARKRATPPAYLIAPDGDDEPTLWACGVAAHTVMGEPCDCDRPVSLTRMCDVGNARAWAVLVVGAQVVGGLK